MARFHKTRTESCARIALVDLPTNVDERLGNPESGFLTAHLTSHQEAPPARQCDRSAGGRILRNQARCLPK